MDHYPHRKAQWHSLGFLTGAISSTKLPPVCAHPVCADHQSFLLAPGDVTVPTTGLGTREGPGSGPTTAPPPGCHSTHISRPLSGLRDGAPHPHMTKLAPQKRTPTMPPGLTPTGRNW